MRLSERVDSYFERHPRQTWFFAASIVVGIAAFDFPRIAAAKSAMTDHRWSETVALAAFSAAATLPILVLLFRPSLGTAQFSHRSWTGFIVASMAVWLVPFSVTHHRHGPDPSLSSPWLLGAAIFSDVFAACLFVAGTVLVLKRLRSEPRAPTG